MNEATMPMSASTWRKNVKLAFPEAIIKPTSSGTLTAVAPWDEVGRYSTKRREGWIAGVRAAELIYNDNLKGEGIERH